jgi:predicted Zn-dependent protease
MALGRFIIRARMATPAANMLRSLRAFVLLTPLALPLLALAACSTNPATGKQSFTAFMSKEDELRVGAEEHPKMIKEFGGAYGDAKLRAYMNRIGLRLAAVSEGPGLKFTFTVLNDDKVNAFALPGGYVYVTRGIMALAENEAEIAGVVAHEIGHVTARHTAERYSTTMAANLGLMVLDIVGSSAGLPSGVGQIAGFGAQAALMGYSRDQELEADMLGVRYMTRAGYDPNAMGTFFAKMQAHAELEQAMIGKQDGPANNIMSTHPRTIDRIHQAIQLAHAQTVPRPTVGRDEYLAGIEGLVFGDDPAQGVRQGRVFAHPELRFRFEAPPGFVLFNSPRQVVGRGPGQAVMIFDMASEKAAREAGRMADYLKRKWAGNLPVTGVEGIDVNGLEGATGQARVNTRNGPRDVRLIAVRGAPDRVFRFLFITAPARTSALNEDFRRTTYSLRRLSEAEAKAIRPLRLTTTTVKAGDTGETLAAAIPWERFRQRWFEVLNGLKPGQMPPVGARVKTVVN